MKQISKRKAVASIFAGMVLAATIGSAAGDPAPPTNGGNGAGSSGQCTGNPDDRPASCHK